MDMSIIMDMMIIRTLDIFRKTQDNLYYLLELVDIGNLESLALILDLIQIGNGMDRQLQFIIPISLLRWRSGLGTNIMIIDM